MDPSFSDLPPVTLLDIKNHLYCHFLEKTSFSLKDDLNSVRLGGVYDDSKGKMAQYKEPLFRAALDDMVKTGILLVLDAVNGVYILVHPLVAFNQTVVVSPYTANLVADVFNTFARQTNATPYIANKLAITDSEIHAVAEICCALRDELDSIYEDMEGDDDEHSGPPQGPVPGVGFDPTNN